MKNFIKPIVMTLLGCLLLGALGFTVYRYYQQSGQVTEYLIADHIEQLAQTFKKIDDDVEVQNIMRDKSYIDFLNVVSFTGSEIGSLNVAYPDRWKGPYMQDNPTMQGKVYEIIKTREGYYIVPGEGVKLENGKIIGKDILFTYDTDMESLVNDTIGLEYQRRPLIAPLSFKKHITSEAVTASELSSIED